MIQYTDQNGNAQYLTPTAKFFELVMGMNPRAARKAEKLALRKARHAGLITGRRHIRRKEGR